MSKEKQNAEIYKSMCEELFNSIEKQYREIAKVKAESEQIEEIDELTSVLYEANHKKSVLDYRWLATEAYNVGYRKQSEGEWIIKGLANPKCSACNSYNRCGDKSDFCPNCGAKMKGEKE